VRVVDIQFNRSKKFLNFFLCLSLAVNHAFNLIVFNYSSYWNFVKLSITRWRKLLVGVVKCKRHWRSRHWRIAALVNQFLEFLNTNEGHAWDSHNEANCIQNIWFSWSVVACDCIKLRIQIFDTCSYTVAFEAINYDFCKVHTFEI